MQQPPKKSNVYHNKQQLHRRQVRHRRMFLCLLILLVLGLLLCGGYLLANAFHGAPDSTPVSSVPAGSSALDVIPSETVISSSIVSAADSDSAAETVSSPALEPVEDDTVSADSSTVVSTETASSSAVSETEADETASAAVSSEAASSAPAAASAAWSTAGEEGFPYLIAVNRTTQTVTVYGKDGEGNYTVPVDAMICSTGTYTPIGEFHTTDQYTWRYLEGGVYGQYATRITGHILFHSVPYFTQDKGNLEYEEFNKLGTPASLGCVRLQVEDCKWIYDACPSGTPVVIFDGDSSLDPLGNPGFTPIDTASPNVGWDPSDPDPANPWNL